MKFKAKKMLVKHAAELSRYTTLKNDVKVLINTKKNGFELRRSLFVQIEFYRPYLSQMSGDKNDSGFDYEM